MGAQPPLGPEQLEAPPMEGRAFVESLRQQRQERYPEPPAFYQALCAGELKQEDLQAWVKDLYHYWDHGVVYSTAAIFIKTNDEPVRTSMLRRMVDIEGKDVVADLSGGATPSWEELWLRLAEGLGVSRSEVEDWKPYSRTHFAITTLISYSRHWDWSWLDGVATFYAADLHGADHLAQVEQALRQHYNVPDAALAFFQVYLNDVQKHIPWEQDALAYWCCTTERQLLAARAFRERLDIEHQLLSGVEAARGEGRAPFQVPGFVLAAGTGSYSVP